MFCPILIWGTWVLSQIRIRRVKLGSARADVLWTLAGPGRWTFLNKKKSHPLRNTLVPPGPCLGGGGEFANEDPSMGECLLKMLQPYCLWKILAFAGP